MSTHCALSLGWLLIMPDGHPYAWHSATECLTADSAWERFEPKAAERAVLRGGGWTVVAGDATSLIRPVLQPQRVSA